MSCTFCSIQKGIKHKFIYIGLFIYGFIIWNLHNAKLSSYLTTPSLGKTLNTIEDINRANVTLWGNYYRNVPGNFSKYMQMFYPSVYSYEQKLWKGKFNYSIKTEDFFNKLYEFDTSHGYLIPEIKWNFISRSQMLLTRKLFSFSKECLLYGFLYPFKMYSGYTILQDIVTTYIMKVIESGLDFAWEELSYQDIKFKFQTDFDKSEVQVLGFPYFEVAW